MQDVTNRTYFVSTYKTDKTEDENYSSLLLVADYLKSLGLPYKIAEGKYNGTVEKTLVVVGDNNVEPHINRIARDYRQDAYMVVYWDKATEFVYSDGKREQKGFFEQTDNSNLSGLTMLDGKVYTVVSRD